MYNQIMAGKIIKRTGILFMFLWLAACTGAPDAASVPITETSQVSVLTEIIPLPTATPTRWSAVTVEPTNTPVWTSEFVHEENADGSWFVEYVGDWGTDAFSLYRVGEAEPFLVQDKFSYYEEHPEEKDILHTDQAPSPASWGIPAWSPDGRYLAFLGAIDGPSSDLYVFDTKTEKINRLTTGENQAAEIIWSPDSQWILHREQLTKAGDGAYLAYWAAKADGSEVRWLYAPNGAPIFLMWVDDFRFYVYDHTVFGASALRFVNLKSNTITSAYNLREYYEYNEGGVMRFAIDPATGAVLYEISGDFEFPPYYAYTYYLTTPDHPEQRIVVSGADNIERSYDREWENYAQMVSPYEADLTAWFYCRGDDVFYYTVTPDGIELCTKKDE